MKHFRSYCDQRHAPLSPNRYYRVAVEKEAKWAVVVDQLVDQLLPTLEISGSTKQETLSREVQRADTFKFYLL